MEARDEKEQQLEALRKFSNDNGIEMIGIDDSFGFKCQQCGKCCMHREDIILNPFDVYNGAKYLGITPLEFIKEYCNADLGSYSKIPIVLLATTKNGFCPLLEYDIKSGGKFKCKIHPAKPGACANHPIGVAYCVNKETGESGAEYVKVSQCPNSVSDEQHTVRDWLKSYLDHQEEINIAHEIQHLSTKHFNPRHFWLLLGVLRKIGENASKDKGVDDRSSLFDTALHHFLATTVAIGYTHYDTNKPFIEQAEENIKKMDVFYAESKALYDDLLISYKEIVGRTFEEDIERFENERKGEMTDGSSECSE